jgi:transcription termination/antitermination protein NusA
MIKVIAEEKNLPEDTVKEIIEQALAAAYRRDYADRDQNIRVSLSMATGNMDAFIVRDIVEDAEFESELTQITVADAQKIRPEAVVGETVEEKREVSGSFGRVAAQTAKQVILQRLREAERDVVMDEYQDKIQTIINGIVSRVEGRIVRFELGKAQGIMPASEQIQGERYHPGQRLKVYLKDVEKSFRGPQLVLSRGCTQFVELLFQAEVPELEMGAVSMKGIAREAGVRTKLAVFSNVQGVDPVGTFVGGHGTRVNAVVSEIGEQEKIDIVVWDADIATYISNALSPTKVARVLVDESAKRATVYVPQDQLSVAIGKGGQNVRLASKLTGYELDILAEQVAEVVPASEAKAAPRLKRKDELEHSLLDAIDEHAAPIE